MTNTSPSRKQAIAERWFALTVQTYPAQSRQFLQREKDPFRNPVGQALHTHLPALLGELLGDMNPENVARSLGELMRMRAVQHFSAREALSFLFLLKRVLREELPADEESRVGLDNRIDDMALTAFDIFMRCREQIYQLQANEAKRSVAVLQRIRSSTERRE